MIANVSWPPMRILCVDDNRDCADLTARLLNLAGFDAIACYDGSEALVLNQTHHPGLCFIDLHMPRMDGDELAKRLQTGVGWHPLLLVAVTAASDELSRERTRTAGFGLHLIKPVRPACLLEVAGKLFQESGGADAINEPR